MMSVIRTFIGAVVCERFHQLRVVKSVPKSSKMPNYKLTYFPFMGMGEPIRYLFNYAGIPFEDDRFDIADWPTKIKPTTPFGQVPVLEVDGKKVCQSMAISRYLAKQCGLAGKDDWEALEIDSTVNTLLDVNAKIAAFHYEENAEAKAAKRKIADDVVPFYLERLDAQVKNNGGYLVGGTLSWADLIFVALLDSVNYMWESDLVEKYENLKQLREIVLNIPAIKTWVEKRPKTEY